MTATISSTLHTEPFTAFNASFHAVLGAQPMLARVVDIDAHEGPVYVPAEDCLYFTCVPQFGGAGDVPMVAIKRLALAGTACPITQEHVSVVSPDANAANGMTLGQDGALLACEQGTHSQHARISRLDPSTGAKTTVVDEWHGLRLNSPNDVIVRSDGSVWFTDPSYGFLQGFRPEPQVGDFLYRYDPIADALSVVDDSCNSGRSLTNRRLLAVITPGFPDGITVDIDGRVYVSSFAGVQVLPLGVTAQLHLAPSRRPRFLRARDSDRGRASCLRRRAG